MENTTGGVQEQPRKPGSLPRTPANTEVIFDPDPLRQGETQTQQQRNIKTAVSSLKDQEEEPTSSDDKQCSTTTTSDSQQMTANTEQQPLNLQVEKDSTALPEGLQQSESEKMNPLTSLFRRGGGADAQRRATSGIIHPASVGLRDESANAIKKTSVRQEPWTLSELNLDAETIRRKQVKSVYALALVPLGMTAYRVFFANVGPTWFSFHPIMMCISIASVLTSVVCQRMGGRENTRLVGTLSFAAGLALLLGLYVVASSKEMYAKVHFISMHSHLGGMTLLAVLSYVATAFYVYNPIPGTPRQNEMWQRRLMTMGKSAVASAILGMSLGVWEVERSYLILPIWMGTIYLMAPFVILPFFNDESDTVKTGSTAEEERRMPSQSTFKEQQRSLPEETVSS